MLLPVWVSRSLRAAFVFFFDAAAARKLWGRRLVDLVFAGAFALGGGMAEPLASRAGAVGFAGIGDLLLAMRLWAASRESNSLS